VAMGSAATACVATLDGAATLAPPGVTKPGGTIGAPMVALDASGAVAGVAGAGVGGAVADVGAATRGGAAARNPASVFAIGDIGADSQSSPSNTLPSAIAATAL
jgi:hypothetical protein